MTALLYIHDHLINAIGSRQISCLCLLDLSAAFDTIDHNILLTYNGRPTESRMWWSIERRHFQWPWTTPTPGFKVMPFFHAEYLRNSTKYRHSFNGILIGTYTRPTQQCHFAWPWVTKQNIQWHEASRSLSATAARSLSATAEFLVTCGRARLNDAGVTDFDTV